ncbi:MAG: GGDEF domain-containing protein [Campylobacter sp.]|nr:GGDEF domain-containing protein [Campylobacter sp.]
MTQDFVDQGSYKAIEDIYKLILNIMMIGNLFGLIFLISLNTLISLNCFLFFMLAVIIRLKFKIKYRILISFIFHLNVISETLIGVIYIGWNCGIWIILAGTIFANYFLAFNSRAITYGVCMLELGLLIYLYSTYGDLPIAVPHWIEMTMNIVNILLVFYTILKLSIYANVITSSGYRQIHEEKERLEKMSKHDFLTGLLNRRTIEKVLKYELGMLGDKSTNTNLVVMLGDIDDFKKINDTYGHDWGDMILKEIAKALMNTFRKDDYVCRWGGEEFLIILPDTKIDFIHKITSRLTKNINYVKLPDKTSVSMTFGMLVCINGVSAKFEYVVNKVDKLLYKGKQHGKDRIEMEILNNVESAKNDDN